MGIIERIKKDRQDGIDEWKQSSSTEKILRILIAILLIVIFAGYEYYNYTEKENKKNNPIKEAKSNDSSVSTSKSATPSNTDGRADNQPSELNGKSAPQRSVSNQDTASQESIRNVSIDFVRYQDDQIKRKDHIITDTNFAIVIQRHTKTHVTTNPETEYREAYIYQIGSDIVDWTADCANSRVKIGRQSEWKSVQRNSTGEKILAHICLLPAERTY